jgi:hypothetical protein
VNLQFFPTAVQAAVKVRKKSFLSLQPSYLLSTDCSLRWEMHATDVIKLTTQSMASSLLAVVSFRSIGVVWRLLSQSRMSSARSSLSGWSDPSRFFSSRAASSMNGGEQSR